jgi:hypothetical protein
VIFSADFLPDRWHGHIEETEKQTTQMRDMSDASSASLHRGEKFDKTVEDHHILSGNREEKIEVDEPVWEKPAEGQKDSIDCSGGTNDRDSLIQIRSKEDCADARTDAAEKKIPQEFLRSPVIFQFSSKHPEAQKVKEEMSQSPV